MYNQQTLIQPTYTKHQADQIELTEPQTAPTSSYMQSHNLQSISHKSSILIVDDQLAIRRIITRILQTEGYELHTASNGQEALELAAKIIPDVILLDVLMPEGLSGFEVCRRLREMPILNDVPILMVTALDDRESRLEGIKSGADDFIVKPFDPIELQARVKNITRLNRYRRLLVERLKFEWVVEESEEGYVIINEKDFILYANNRAQLFLDLAHSPRVENHDTFMRLVRRQYNCEPSDSWTDWPLGLTDRDDTTRYLIRPETDTSPAFWLKVTTLKLPLGSETLYAIRMRDVTQEMTSHHTVWQLHAMIFHKLRTPFSSVLMSLELLNSYHGELPEDEVEMLQSTALTQANRLNQVMHGMLRYVESTVVDNQVNGCELSSVPDIASKVSEMLELTSTRCLISEQLGDAKIRFSEDSLSTILWEVMRNAQKFHPKQAPEIEIVIEKASRKKISLRVIDNGITLPPDQLLAVWQPYYQAERNFTGEVPGAGLGLTAVALLTWQIGGQYKIYNRPDTPGVVVELILPLMI